MGLDEASAQGCSHRRRPTCKCQPANANLKTTTDGRPLAYRPAAQLSPWLKFTHHHDSTAISDRMLDAGERTVLNLKPSVLNTPAPWRAAYL